MNLKSIVFAAVTGALATSAYAAQFKINAIPVAQYSAAGALVAGNANNNAPVNATLPGYYAVNLYLQFTPDVGADAIQAFGNLTFDLVASGGVSRPAAVVGAVQRNYASGGASPAQFDSDDDGAIDTPFLGFNQDAGNDWAAVLIGVNTQQDTSGFTVADPRTSLGKTTTAPNTDLGYRFGRAFVNFASEGALTVNAYDPSIWNPQTGLLASAGTTVPAVVNFNEIPEPASLGLAAIAGLGLIRRRRA